MAALIHTISATEFKGTLTAQDRREFLADIASEWVNDDGTVTMPVSYSLLFERRVAQAATLAEVPTETLMAEVIALATQMAEDGDYAWHRTLHLVDFDEDDEIEVPEERSPATVEAAAALAS